MFELYLSQGLCGLAVWLFCKAERCSILLIYGLFLKTDLDALLGLCCVDQLVNPGVNPGLDVTGLPTVLKSKG